ncbi:MAG: putative bifunctional diguanylate cyclase/phosphodiesterase [Mycobacterium sp.]
MTAPTPSTRRVAVAAAVVFAVFTGWLLSGVSQGYALKAIDDIALVAVSVPALVFAVLAARSTQGRLRAGWSCLAAGLTVWTIAEVLWTYYELVLREVPFPSLADVFFLLFPIGAGAALLLFWNPRRGESRGRILLDALIVAGSLFIVSWLLVMSRLNETREASTLEFILSLAYPVTDLILLTMSAVVLVSAQAPQRLSMTLLTVGLACMAIADSGYAYLSAQREYVSGDLIDIGWVAGLLLLTVAAAAGRDAPPHRFQAADMPGWASVWLPYAPLMLAAGVLAISPPEQSSAGPVLAVGLVLVFTVLGRQFLAVRENRRLLAVVADQALRDPLTGLANRALFGDRLNHAMTLRARDGQSLGVLAIDLDEFKLVNDTLGHAAGDELLVAVADRLRGAVRAGDTVSRLGGDEFGVILEGAPHTAEPLARKVAEAFNAPFVIDGHEVMVRPSVGFAVAQTAGPRTGREVEDLLKRADEAMYAAKRSRADRSTLWRSQENPSAGDELLAELRDAVEQQKLTMVYQPKFDLKSSGLVGVEALLRWPRQEGELLGPDEFLPMVRRHGLIGPVTDFVLTRALDDAARWYAAGAQVPVAINLFPPSLAMPNLPERIRRELADRNLSPSALTVEITEDMVLDNLARTRTVLSELRGRGILVAIDDFGSGYSALSYLRDLPVDEVKLDRDFIAPITRDPRAAAVARAVIDVARVLCLTTVAEGVEDIETVNCLREFGCDFVQGYFYSQPLTADQVLELARHEVHA